MTGLFERVERLFRAGHDEPADGLRQDHRADVLDLAPAAVLIAITEREDNPGLLMLHRPSNMRSHPGQVAFPGGRIDPGETPVEAALREAWEELGIHPDVVRVIGTTDVFRAGSGYEITPVLGIVPPDIEIRPNPAEVAKWFEAPADFVLDPANHGEGWMEWGGKKRSYVEIWWEEHRIWGVTGAIVANLAQRLNWHG
jgi:8-oxo-dGTP pyrophosphatase MutT (NUDIX family)